MNEDSTKAISIWDKVASDFGEVGPSYWNEFGNRLVQLSNINSGARVLDIGMGRGASLFPASNRVGESGYLIGIDSSKEMVRITNEVILARNISNARVKIIDTGRLDFEDNSFDNVICGFGMGYLLASENKLSDILRVLKNDGQAGFSIWGVQEDQKWLTEIINKYLLIPTDSVKVNIPKFDSVDNVIQILNDAGFNKIKVHEENSVVIYKDKEEWWQEMHANAVRGIFEKIEMTGSDHYEAFKNEVFDVLERFKKYDGLHFRMPVIYAFGEKVI